MIVENRPGANTLIAAEFVANSEPDGNTLLLNAPYLLINPQVRKVSYDPLTSFEPICDLVSSPGIIAVNGEAARGHDHGGHPWRWRRGSPRRAPEQEQGKKGEPARRR